jgi:hypothetical protein
MRCVQRISDPRIAISSNAFSYLFDDRIKCVRLAPEPKRVVIALVTRKEELSPMAEKLCQCAKEAFGALR